MIRSHRIIDDHFLHTPLIISVLYATLLVEESRASPSIFPQNRNGIHPDSNRGESIRYPRLKSDIHPSMSKDLTNLQTAKLELPLKKVSYERKIRARHRCFWENWKAHYTSDFSDEECSDKNFRLLP